MERQRPTTNARGYDDNESASEYAARRRREREAAEAERLAAANAERYRIAGGQTFAERDGVRRGVMLAMRTIAREAVARGIAEPTDVIGDVAAWTLGEMDGDEAR